ASDPVEVDPLEHRAPVALEAAREIADPRADQDLGVDRAAAGDEPAYEPPVADAPAADVARAERDIGAVLDGGDEPGHVLRIVREVAVHLEHELGALGERAPEAGEIRGSEAFLALAVQHADELELAGEAVGDRAGAVGRAVVDDEDAVAGPEHLAERADHRLEI